MIIFLEGFAGFASDGRKENSNQCRWESHGTVLQNGQNNPASEYGFTRGRATPTVCRLVVRRRGVIMPVRRLPLICGVNGFYLCRCAMIYRTVYSRRNF